MALNPKKLKPGEEQYEKFTFALLRKMTTSFQYDYRDTDGELFSCVRPTLDACRQARNEWLEKKVNCTN